MKHFSVKNYEQFQHYKDRSPPWIKFYNSVLDDYAFTSLPDASRSHLVAIWLLASRTNNRIPYDAEWVRMSIKAQSPVDLELLVKAGFIIVDQGCSETLANRTQEARPEREKRESRVETEKEEAHEAVRAEVLPPELIPDPRKAIFDDGLRWLSASTNKPRDKLRPLMARWIKARGDPEVAAAIIAAQQAGPVEPISWIEARLKSNERARPSDLQRRRSLAEAFLSVGTSGDGENPPPPGETLDGLPHGTG